MTENSLPMLCSKIIAEYILKYITRKKEKQRNILKDVGKMRK